MNLAADLTRLRFLHYLMPMMLRRSVATGLIRAARMSESVTAEDLFADLDYVTAVVGREIATLRSRAERDGLGAALRDENDPRGALLESACGQEFLREFDASLSRIGASTSRMYLPFSNRSVAGASASAAGPDCCGTRYRHTHRARSARTSGIWSGSGCRGAARAVGSDREGVAGMHIGREGTLYLIEEAFVLARCGMDEIAGRLVDRGVLDHADDIRFATFEEVRAALLDHRRPL